MKTETINIADNLKLATFDDFNIINDFLKKHPIEKCDFNICNIFTWELFSKLQYTFYLDRLILFNPSYVYFLSPIGEELSAKELFYIHSSFQKKYNDIELLGVSEKYVNNNPDLADFFDIKNDETLADYIYTAESLVNLSGKKLAKKKNLISQFTRLYPDFSVKPVHAVDYGEIIDFCHYWKEEHDLAGTHEIESEKLDLELEAIKSALTHWDLLPCDGTKVYAAGKLCAFSIYSPQTVDMATVHFEKYDHKVKGAGQVINHETAKILIGNFQYINREQDMGSPGMRQAKRSYQPVRMLPFYRLKPR